MLLWICLAIPLFCMPTAVSGLSAETMNYASVVFVAFALISVVWYFVWGRRNFSGPAVLKTLMQGGEVGVVKGEALTDAIAQQEAGMSDSSNEKKSSS